MFIEGASDLVAMIFAFEVGFEAGLAEGVFGRLRESKSLDPIKLEISKIGIENMYEKEKIQSRSLFKTYKPNQT